MPPTVRRWFANQFVLALGMALLLGTLVPVAPVAAATDRLPDLRAATSATCASSGRTAPAAALHRDDVEHGRRARSRSAPTARVARAPWDVDQIIYDTDGGTRRIETDRAACSTPATATITGTSARC